MRILKNILLLQLVILLFINVQSTSVLADEETSTSQDIETTAILDETNTSTTINPMYPVGCIPEIALPVFPESKNCVANYALEIPDFTDSAVTVTETTSTSVTTTTKTPTPSKQNSTAPTTQYYSQQQPQPYYALPVYPQSTQSIYPTGAFAIGVMGGLMGAAIYNNNNNDDSDDDNSNTYYWNKWTGDNGSAAYRYGDEGGAYYWHYNDYSGGGYCYEGDCQHKNNWDGSNNSSTVNSTTTLNSTNALRTATPSTTTTPQNNKTNTQEVKKHNAPKKVTSQDTNTTKKYSPSTRTTTHIRREPRERR
jgi:hypothetical protein